MGSLEERIEQNTMELKKLENLEQDFSTLLDNKCTMVYKHCKNMKIFIRSKINRVILKGCDDMELHLAGLISGLEISYCSSIIVKNIEANPINVLTVENSIDVLVIIPKKLHKKTISEIDNSINVKMLDPEKLTN